MAELAPSQLPELLIPQMNADHAFEVRLLNDVEAALAAHRRGEGTLGQILERLSLLAVHTREHFLREEAMMREAGFPAYASHKAEHDRVLAQMDAEARAFRERGDVGRFARYLAESLPAWYAGHTATMDVMAARFVAGAPAAAGSQPPALQALSPRAATSAGGGTRRRRA